MRSFLAMVLGAIIAGGIVAHAKNLEITELRIRHSLLIDYLKMQFGAVMQECNRGD